MHFQIEFILYSGFERVGVGFRIFCFQKPAKFARKRRFFGPFFASFALRHFFRKKDQNALQNETKVG